MTYSSVPVSSSILSNTVALHLALYHPFTTFARELRVFHRYKLLTIVYKHINDGTISTSRIFIQIFLEFRMRS